MSNREISEDTLQFMTNPNTLVLVGGWNANIVLNTDWVKRYLLPQEDLKLEIQIPPIAPPTVAGDNIKISLVGPRLCFSPKQNEVTLLEKIQEVGVLVADHLPHTPVSALGVNFAYESEFPEGALLNRAEKILAEQYGTPGEMVHRYSIPWDNCVLNIAIKTTDKCKAVWDFNFHYEIKSLGDFKGKVAECSVRKHEQEARRTLVSLLTGLQVK